MDNKIYSKLNNSLTLLELDGYFKSFIKLYEIKKFPKVTMLTGTKGIGKSTLVNHFLNYVYDKDSYDLENNTINTQSNFNKQYLSNTFSNIIYLSGENFKNIKVDNIRDLKSKLLKTTILNKERFIIFDDVELFNINSLNALLKIIEEPTIKNYFILINNKTRPLIDTIPSRSLEFKIKLTNSMRLSCIEKLIKINNLEVKIDYKSSWISPGCFLNFNNILIHQEIDINDDFLINIKNIFDLYKKNKDKNLIDLSLYIADFYFKKLIENKLENIESIIEKKTFIIKSINKFFIYNLNQTALINALNNKLSNG